MSASASLLVVTLDSAVDPRWMRTAADACVFAYGCCGYWARGVEYQEHLGWLVWESLDHCRHGDEPNRDGAMAAWLGLRDLPPGWLRLDTSAMLRGWIEGVRRWGERWFQSADQERYDVVLQLALLGEVRYG